MQTSEEIKKVGKLSLTVQSKVLIFTLQVRLDIDELSRLMELAQRPKVRDTLTIELRRYETKLAQLIDQEDVETKVAKTPAAVTATAARTYDVVVKNYCRLE
jgi:cell division FtsZ-interacting protein ZapD